MAFALPAFREKLSLEMLVSLASECLCVVVELRNTMQAFQFKFSEKLCWVKSAVFVFNAIRFGLTYAKKLETLVLKIVH